MQDLAPLILPRAPPLDPSWLAHESAANLLAPKPSLSAIDRQPLYAASCRALNASMMAPGARDHHLSRGISISSLTIPSTVDGFAIPVLRYETELTKTASGGGKKANEWEEKERKEKVILVYYHGGGLVVGEADSEDLSCRRLVLQSGIAQHLTLYSVGYRLMPQVPACTCVPDALDAFTSICNLNRGAKFILVGSSSGGELAALVSQMAPRGSVHGVLLRCPVTSDAFSGPQYVPARLRAMHTSASESFVTSLLGFFTREVPRDGLERMPLEIGEEELVGLPRTWIQICTNDVLYSDGLCYAKALQDAGVPVKVDVVVGYPHTFWLKAPQLQRALEADEEMLRGLVWAADV
ncbi:Alpha/Beta hydrolase protein [Pseudomassariella vexata]|uniref:Alpha/Beta hydrolase protein n=1 Tax=Pseudomassariella vexata TaxID=1141098 RepID=A0A1Y2E986_9PEZI|nr:Alpha/Beta hydrolase protein [Pseudomassariella vexata]ORY67425.1 Alpha/Beta hydrolase protein [Pseudomassariella vexata]